jgi:hypothetical protein
MTKIAAFGTILNIGTRQVETATVVGSITGSGNARTILTATGLVTGSPVTTDVAVLNLDTADTVIQKIRTALGGVTAITDRFAIGGSGAQVVLTALLPAADNGTINLSIDNLTCTGLTAAPTSANTLAGVAYVAVAQVENIGGPAVTLDTTDVTTHDSALGWEEIMGTILRSGEVKLDLVYDPNGASQKFSANGLGDRYQNKIPTRCQLVFPGPYTWTFNGYITGFDPSAPTEDALTATVTVKITDAPTLV